MKVSIIIPMYLCESYVDSLFSSLLSQDYTDFEIICVVDGSPDNTLALVQECSKKDERVSVINVEHRGAGVARNIGMDNARGDYLMFLDADDDYQSDFIGKMVRAMEESDADIGVCQYASYNQWDGLYSKNAGFSEAMLPKDRDIIVPMSLKDPMFWFSSVAHNKIFRKSFVENCGLRFSSTMSINDIFFVNATILSAENVVLIRERLYTYRTNHNIHSITSNRDLFRSDVFTVFDELYSWIIDNGFAEHCTAPFCKRWGGLFRSYARYGVSAEFQDMAVRYLTEKEPWKSMDDKMLYRVSGLDTSVAVIKKRIAEMRLKRLKKNTESPSCANEQALAIERAEREIRQSESELANISAIRHRLCSEYHRNVDRHDNIIRAGIWRIEDFGFGQSLSLLLKKLKA